jgi:lysophospholipase L1-like esterase
MRYQPIENHGIVGNLHSAALLSPGGTPSNGVLGDGVHPTAAGYQILAGEILPTVMGLLAAGPAPSR